MCLVTKLFGSIPKLNTKTADTDYWKQWTQIALSVIDVKTMNSKNEHSSKMEIDSSAFEDQVEQLKRQATVLQPALPF